MNAQADSGRMRAGWAVGLMFALLSVTTPTVAPGPVVTAAGSATGQATDGSFVCHDATMVAQITYLPTNNALLAVYWVGDLPDCPHDGTAYAVGQFNYSTLQWQFTCVGNAADGIRCGYSDGEIRVGPYGGPGSTMWLTGVSSAQVVSGLLTAV